MVRKRIQNNSLKEVLWTARNYRQIAKENQENNGEQNEEFYKEIATS